MSSVPGEHAAARQARGMGCDTAQGHGISRPMSLPDLRGWLTRWNEIRYEQIERFEAVNP